MLFNSAEFLIFFAIVCIFAWFAAIKNAVIRMQIILLSASLFFYAFWNPFYLILILFSVYVTWQSALLMEKMPQNKKPILVISLVLNLAILFFFKYFNFFAGLVNRISVFAGIKAVIPQFSVLLPVGISFYTFQALGYSIDVYKGSVKAEKSILAYTLFVTFFPQLVAGPIERTENLLPQFKEVHKFDYDRVVEGLLLATWGMFKKVFIADRLVFYVNMIYGNLLDSTGVALLTATVFFAFQIFCDFSSYSDIAIGIAKVLGFNLMRNFGHPYFSKSIAEFWRRWHISLSSWFKDYVYIPLGGNRVSIPRYYFNLFAVFMLSGLWHGASLHFVAWGALHGFYQIAGHATKPFRVAMLKKCRIIEEGETKRWFQWMQTAFTFGLVCIGWIFFRAPGFRGALQIGKRIFFIPKEILQFINGSMNEGFLSSVRNLFCIRWTCVSDSLFGLALCVFCIGILFVTSLCTRKERGYKIVRNLPIPVRWCCYLAVFYGAFLPVLYNVLQNIPVSQFVYFQF